MVFNDGRSILYNYYNRFDEIIFLRVVFEIRAKMFETNEYILVQVWNYVHLRVLFV